MSRRRPLQPSISFISPFSNSVAPETPPEQLEHAPLKKAFFVEVIRLAPEGTDLVITSDYWDGLPSLFGERMTVSTASKGEEWVVELTLETKDFVVQQALNDDVHTKFVHFYLVESHKELFTSYDQMACLILDHDFPNYYHILTRFADLIARIA